MGRTVPPRTCPDPTDHDRERWCLTESVLLGPVFAEAAGLHLETVTDRGGRVSEFWWKVMRCRCTFVASFDGALS